MPACARRALSVLRTVVVFTGSNELNGMQRGRAMWRKRRWSMVVVVAAMLGLVCGASAQTLSAGVGKVDITNRDAGPVNDPLHAKALVLKSATTALAIVTLDVVALERIGPIPAGFLPAVRGRIESELGIPASNVLINASHCHGIVCGDVIERTVQAVREAAANAGPVRIGAGTGHEDRIQENRRYILTTGAQADGRRAYPLPPDAQIAAAGPIDPEIGVLRVDRPDGSVLAAVYVFACHPIQGVPSGGNTADLAGFASKAIEDSLGGGATALFVQGCGGDINPAHYKDVDRPRDAEPLGTMLGVNTVKALRGIETREDDRLTVVNETIRLPRADFGPRIAALEEEQERLLGSLGGTNINLKTFVPLAVKHGLFKDYPSAPAHRYLHEEKLGRDDRKKLDAENAKDLEQYIKNVETMEALVRARTNLELLRRHQAENQTAGKPTVDAEILGVRIGDFVLVTFPGELTVEIGLNIKRASPHEATFVAGYTNGYLFYAPTADQLQNTGAAQEDCDTILAPEWQSIFERVMVGLLKVL